MDTRFNIGNFRVYIGVKRMTWVDGVNSKLDDGGHFLMWDFDDVDPEELSLALEETQKALGLPNIYILSSGKPRGYHAYCFKRYSWDEAFAIVWRTPRVCQTFVKMAFVRGYFTLRYSAKSGREISFERILVGPAPEDVDPRQIHNFVRYYTKGG